MTKMPPPNKSAIYVLVDPACKFDAYFKGKHYLISNLFSYGCTTGDFCHKFIHVFLKSVNKYLF